MRNDIPIPGTTREKLMRAGIRLFSQHGYEAIDVDRIAAEAGVTSGPLYHHFKSKKAFYGLLRDDMTRRILDRMEAVVESVEPERAVQAALLAAYDGALRIEVGKLLTEPDPRDVPDAIACLLGELAAREGNQAAPMLGTLLAAVLRAALIETLKGHEGAREALAKLLASAGE
jgi:AcrR family transcriptional regulator